MTTLVTVQSEFCASVNLEKFDIAGKSRAS